MTAKYLRSVWNEHGKHVMFRICAHCTATARPAVFAMMRNYVVSHVEMARYAFCSQECADVARALRRLGLQHQRDWHDGTAQAKMAVAAGKRTQEAADRGELSW